MKILSVYLLAASLACNPALYSIERDPDTAMVYEIGAKGWDGQIAAIKKLSSEQRARLIATIKSKAFPEESRQQKQDLLVHLGDEETILKQAETLIKGYPNDSLSALKLLTTYPDPRVIEAIAPAIFIEDDLHQTRLVYLRSLCAMEAILEMLAKTPGFSPEIYEWAPKAAESYEMFQLPIIREWWKENAGHFRAHDYMLVKPGRFPPPFESVEVIHNADGSPKMKPDGTVEFRIKATTTPAPAMPEPSAQTPAIPESIKDAPHQNKSRRSYTLVAVSALALAIGLFTWMKRPRPRR